MKSIDNIKWLRPSSKISLLLVCFFTIMAPSVWAQVKLGDNPNNINSSSLLELESKTKGFLWPRMNIQERDALNLPPKGLTIYNLDNECVEVNIGTHIEPNWICLSQDSDNQTITQFSLQDTILTISLENDFSSLNNDGARMVMWEDPILMDGIPSERAGWSGDQSHLMWGNDGGGVTFGTDYNGSL